ncbi:N-acetylglucosamine-6-phosphate deacetylase [Shewanella sedimentimangrovi]|uniref:N-acetylgalactosamine-6-phosphate deacetylase n=1 Tax=Shewanella sedimentimangrovi TaxID=2814293 RepID=A0ABX7R4S4_9GAMM|nr:N-acetylglucosamine-6-phosphate deacetylase [Shewanella sedimentimangrovi]QSX38100.1 N-acetylglucosamine-6-phosphate deacetylase [Shewanella sedimentimangrovi]
MKTTYIAERLFDGEQFHHNVPLSVVDGHIVAWNTLAGGREVRLNGTLVPGFIDVQVNGGGGVLFNDSPTLAGIAAIVTAHARFGTTAMLPTLITDRLEVMERAADAVAEALVKGMPGVLGIHFEGPHLSVPKKGVHPQQHIRRIGERELALLCREELGQRVVTLAPENVAPEVIRALVDSGARVCLGHSNADYDTVQAALAAGASGFTHLFNAMSPLTSREPGMVGAALESRETWCGMIVDGHHVHPAAARIAIAAKPKGKIMLVTDAMPPVGQEQASSFELFGSRVLRQGDRLNAMTGELAGCVLDMAGAVQNTVAMLGVAQAEAIRMATLYPAEFLGLADSIGTLKPGMRADMVLLDDAGKCLGTWMAGVQVFGL